MKLAVSLSMPVVVRVPRSSSGSGPASQPAAGRSSRRRLNTAGDRAEGAEAAGEEPAAAAGSASAAPAAPATEGGGKGGGEGGKPKKEKKAKAKQEAAPKGYESQLQKQIAIVAKLAAAISLSTRELQGILFDFFLMSCESSTVKLVQRAGAD